MTRTQKCGNPCRGARGRHMSHSFLSHFAELWCLRGATTNNKECTMDARLNLFANPTAGKMLKYITSAGKVITASTLPAATPFT